MKGRHNDRDLEALEWLVRKQSKVMTAMEFRCFDDWMKDDANRSAFQLAAAGIARIDEFALEIAVEEEARALAALSSRDQWRRACPPHYLQGLFTRRKIFVVGAVLAASVGAFVVVPAIAVTTATYSTGVGERRSVELADGSVVHLNALSLLKVRYSQSSRNAILSEGEALFDVTRSHERPFNVKTAFGEIAVTGTRFDVDITRNGAMVSVIDGVVLVSPIHDSEVSLAAGSALRIDDQKKIDSVFSIDSQSVLAWRVGKVRFKEAPIAEVVEKLNRQFDSPFVVADPALAALRVSAEFELTDQRAVAELLAFGLNVEVTDLGSSFAIRPRKE